MKKYISISVEFFIGMRQLEGGGRRRERRLARIYQGRVGEGESVKMIIGIKTDHLVGKSENSYLWICSRPPPLPLLPFWFEIQNYSKILSITISTCQDNFENFFFLNGLILILTKDMHRFL